MPEFITGPDGAGKQIDDFLPGPTLVTHYSPAQATSAYYADFKVTTYWITDCGVVQLPVAAAPPQNCRIVRHSAPSAQKVVAWEAWRLIDKPALPHWNTGNPNEVLAKHLIVTHSPVPMPGGAGLMWHAEGMYVYYLYATPREGDAYASAATPLFDYQAELLRMEGFQFDETLLRCAAPQDYRPPPDGNTLVSLKTGSLG